MKYNVSPIRQSRRDMKQRLESSIMWPCRATTVMSLRLLPPLRSCSWLAPFFSRQREISLSPKRSEPIIYGLMELNFTRHNDGLTIALVKAVTTQCHNRNRNLQCSEPWAATYVRQPHCWRSSRKKPSSAGSPAPGTVRSGNVGSRNYPEV